MTKQIKVGDTVKVTDSGESYCYYGEWANINGLIKYKEGLSLRNGDQGKVTTVAPHSFPSLHMLVSVEKDGIQYIIGMRGIELVSRKPEIGARVKVTGTEHYRHSFPVGTIGTIIEVANNVTFIIQDDTSGKRQWLHPDDFEPLETKPLDFSKPLETYEGTPVKLLATGGVDAKYPVLVVEGAATVPTKYDLNGKAKNKVVRRFIRNAEAKPVVLDKPKQKKPRLEKTVYINLYENGNVGSCQASREIADSAAERRTWNKRVGVTKVVLQAGVFDD